MIAIGHNTRANCIQQQNFMGVFLLQYNERIIFSELDLETEQIVVAMRNLWWDQRPQFVLCEFASKTLQSC